MFTLFCFALKTVLPLHLFIAKITCWFTFNYSPVSVKSFSSGYTTKFSRGGGKFQQLLRCHSALLPNGTWKIMLSLCRGISSNMPSSLEDLLKSRTSCRDAHFWYSCLPLRDRRILYKLTRIYAISGGSGEKERERLLNSAILICREAQKTRGFKGRSYNEDKRKFCQSS